MSLSTVAKQRLDCLNLVAAIAVKKPHDLFYFMEHLSDQGCRIDKDNLQSLLTCLCMAGILKVQLDAIGAETYYAA